MKTETESSLFRFFFTKTTFGKLALVVILIGGVMAYSSIIKESSPDLKIPIALIRTTWPGASPELVEKQITNHIEKSIKSLEGLKRYLSGSMNSASLIVVEFEADASIEESMQLLRTKVSEAESSFPKEAEKSAVELLAVSDVPIATFVLYGDLDDALLDQKSRNLKEKLEKLPGMKKVEISGNREEIVKIQMIPAMLWDLGISAVKVKNRIAEASVDMPWGKFENEDFTSTVKLEGRFRDLDTLEALPITRLDQGRVVRLGEIASISRDLDKETIRTSVSFKGGEYQKSVTLSLYKRPGEDTVELITKARELMSNEERSRDWPYSLKYMVISDESIQIRDTLKSVFNNGWQAMLAVFIILLIMLTWREALIAGLSIPITFLATLAILWGVGYTLNELVIIGMILALGLLVDDFILMMEGMHDAIGKGQTVQQAQTATLKTYAIPSFSGSLTTILALVPLMAIGGIQGKFIRVIPITATICLTLSYLISIFVDIPLSSLVMRRSANSNQKLSKVDRLTEHASNWLYGWLQTYAIRNKGIAFLWCAGTVLIFFFSFTFLWVIPWEMYPKQDGRNLGISIELTPDSDLEKSQQLADRVGEVLRQKTYFENITKYVGRKSPFSIRTMNEYLSETRAPYQVGFSGLFTPEEQRDKMAYEYLEKLRQEIETELRHFPGALLTLSPDMGGASSEDPIQIELFGEDMETLRQMSAQIQERLAEIPGTTDVRDSLGPTRTDVRYEPLYEALNFYGITENDLAIQMRLAMTYDKVGKFILPGTQDDLDILLGMAWPSRQGEIGGPTTWEELALTSVITPKAERIPVYSLVTGGVDQAAMSITHKNGQRSVSVLAKTQNRTTVEILRNLYPHLQKMRQAWPSGYGYRFAGEAESMTETFGAAGKAMIVAFLLVFAILTLLFDSFRQPFIIMFSVPFALIGTFTGFFLVWIPMSFPAMIGIISLVGIAVNDAIVLIETMNSHRKNGLSVKDAAARGTGDRLRPILSTTVTTIVGLTPLALSSPGWMPLCSAIIFGLIASTLICLFVIPCLFLLLTPKQKSI